MKRNEKVIFLLIGLVLLFSLSYMLYKGTEQLSRKTGVSYTFSYNER